MSGLAGLAAGLAEGFAGGRRLKSDLETEKTRREAMGLQMENQRLQNSELQERRDATTALGELEKNWASGNGFRPEGADENYDYRTDPAAVSKYYDSLRGAMRRQAAAFGRSPAEADKAVDELVKSKYQEKVGQAITLMKSNPSAAIPAIRSVYAGFRDGNEMTGGTYDKATDSFVFNGKDKDGNEIALPPMARRDAIEALSYGALNGADAAKLLIKSFETDKVLKAEEKNLGLRLETTERIAKDDRASKESEGEKDRGNRTTNTILSGQATVAAAGLRGGGSGNEATDARQRLKGQLDSLKEIFNPEYDTIKGSSVASYLPEQRLKDIRAIQNRQGLAEEILRFNFERGNENLSARGVAALTEGLTSGQIDRSRFNGYYVQDGKQDKNYVVMDNGRLVVPTPDWLRREIENKNKPAPAPTERKNGRTGRPM